MERDTFVQKKHDLLSLEAQISYAKSLIDWIDKHRFVITNESIQFFANSSWEAVPLEWREALWTVPVENLQKICEGYYEEAWPESLKEFIKGSRELPLNRNPGSFKDTEVPKDLIFNMRPKKIHEVKTMSEFVESVCKEIGANTVVDVGAGEGYLGHFLAHKKLNVISVESNSSHVQKGENRMAKVDRLLAFREQKKQQSNLNSAASDSNNTNNTNTSTQDVENKSENTANENTTNENATKGSNKPTSPLALGKSTFITKIVSETTLSELTSEIRKLANMSETEKPIFTFTGLHTCGNLANMLINLFLSSEATALVSVGCCYHVCVQDGQIGVFGLPTNVFPVSKTVRELGGSLTWPALKISTNAPFKYRAAPPDDPMVSGSTLAYRAVAQIVFNKHWQGKEFRIKRINTDHYNTFDEYLKLIVNRFCFREAHTRKWIKSKDVTDELVAELKETYKIYEPRFKEITVMIALQMAIADVIESLVLIDRVIYLHEMGAKAGIVPLFDPSISPRNMAIVAVKDANNTELLQRILNLK